MMNIWGALILSAILSLITVPIIIKITKKHNIYAIPIEVSAHKGPTPLLGGIAIALSTIISIIVFSRFAGIDYELWIRTEVYLIFGLSVITIVGTVDDIKQLTPRVRLIIVSILASGLAYGFMAFYFDWSTLYQYVILQIIFFFIIIIWVTGITNAINFVDGLDGLACCLSIVSLIGFAIILYMQGRKDFAVILCAGALGSLIGFLPYNRPPAKIFMGDAGSMFLGFYLASLAIITITKMDSILGAIISLYILFVPIMDTLTSIFRRIIFGKSIFRGDKMHMHHLLSNKYGKIKAVIILTIIHALAVTIGIIMYCINIHWISILVWTAMAVIVFIYLGGVYKNIKNSKSDISQAS